METSSYMIIRLKLLNEARYENEAEKLGFMMMSLPVMSKSNYSSHHGGALTSQT